MTKNIKITLKTCKDIERKELYKILNDIQYQTKIACNKAIMYLYSFELEKLEYFKNTKKNIDEKARFGKSHGAWVENRMNEIMNICHSGNVAQTRQFVSNRFKNDRKKGLLEGECSISNFKKSIPIIIHNESYKIIDNRTNYEITLSLFNRGYQKQNNIKQLNFIVDKLDGNCKSTLNKIINGEYKQGSAQITMDKGKIYLSISFSFEPKKIENLNLNKVLGVDLGITKVATMSVLDNSTNEYERLEWNELFIDGSELIQFRQQIEARKKSLYSSRKIAGGGSVGHGKQTLMKKAYAMSDKVARFRDTYNHKASKYIVQMALKNNCSMIQMENLSGFSEQQTETFLKNWSYHDLQTKIKYKAEEKGIVINFINPKHTSQRCNKCGCIHSDNRNCKENQGKFECVVCGHKDNADINASKNIAILGIEKIIEEQIKAQEKCK